MRRTLTAAGGALAGCALLAHPALAQGGPPDTLGTLAPGAGALIIDQQRQDRQPPAPPPSAPVPAPAAEVEAAAAPAPATALARVTVEGATGLADVDGVVAPFIGRPMQAATIKAVADAVSAAYARTGLALYTVAAPRQDLSGGTLRLRVIEGYVAEVVLAGDVPAASDRLIRAYAARLRAERPLSRATLERYLSLMRDIPGATVDAQLFNTAAPGAVRLSLTVRQKRFGHELSFNNRGTPRLGVAQAQLGLMGYSVLRPGDQLRLTGALPTDVERFQYAGLTYASPVGSDGLTLQGTLSYLRTRPDNPPIEGEAVSAGVQASYPLLRGYRKNLYLSGGIDGLDSDNAIYGLSITSDHTRALRIGLAYSNVTPRRSLSLSGTASQGVDILGARADVRLTDADFGKLNLQAAVNQALGKAVVLRLRGAGQLSHGRLPSAEQLPLGGETFGRAFYAAAVVGDYGYAGSLELGWVSPKAWPSGLAGSEIYGFVDAGKAWTRDRAPFVARNRYDLASAGLGVRLLIRKALVVGLEAAKAVDAPYPGGSKPWRAVISWRTLR
jgi:hemolysin activation/secretion protein